MQKHKRKEAGSDVLKGRDFHTKSDLDLKKQLEYKSAETAMFVTLLIELFVVNS